MNRSQLEHAIRASGAISGDRELYVVGSQAILGAFPDAAPDLCRSMEVDIAPREHPELEALIEGAIGELSPLHDTFGYYVDGVEVAILPLPLGWESCVVLGENENTNGYRGLCLSPADLAASNPAAGREKDVEFVAAMLRDRLISPEPLIATVGLLPATHLGLARALVPTIVGR